MVLVGREQGGLEEEAPESRAKSVRLENPIRVTCHTAFG